MRPLQIPAVLAFAMIGCGGGTSPGDAGVVADGCAVLCVPDGTDAGVCPVPVVCVSEQHTCPAGCMCTAFCFPRTPEGEQNCPVGPQGPPCASPERTCPAGCDPVG